MNLQLTHNGTAVQQRVLITGSKSETNRLLILQALFEGLAIENISNSDDARVMQKALSSDQELVDIHHAGTAMRFLTAYFATKAGRKTVLTGSARMQERPIGILVDALRQLGADIEYLKTEGCPPIRISGKQLTKHKVTLDAHVSSQYISALMLVAASLPMGLEIHLKGKITSVPYINMTLSLLREVGIAGSFEGQEIKILPQASLQNTKRLTVESDWSSASYYYSIAALSPGAEIQMSSYKKESLQGDASLMDIYTQLGVRSSFDGDHLTLRSSKEFEFPKQLVLDLSNSPDIAQTIAVTCLGLGVSCHLTGLHTLKIKETDRLEALYREITKLGGHITVTNDSLTLASQQTSLTESVSIATYHDHRMAMAFAPLALKVPLCIQDAGVVSKSYPDFWKDLETLGFITEEIIIA
jgi:3-phosphoshikimate 1-carboxyvinyltransferase